MLLRKLVSPHLPLALTLMAAAGCVPSSPDYCCVREGHAEYDKCRLDNNVDLPDHPLTLKEIIDIAICRNLDVQVQNMEELAQCERVFAQKLQQLPDLDLNGEFTNRNNDPAWFSRTVNPGGGRNGPPGPIGPFASQSTSRYHRSMNAALAISVIDFGLAFVRSRQEKNRLLLLKQRNMRARQNLVLDIYRAYYRAVVATQAIEEAKDLIAGLQERQEVLQEQIQRQIVSEMKGLVNENRLIDMQVKLYAFENEYRSAMTELSGLMGVPPNQIFALAPIAIEDIKIGDFNMLDLENIALRYRPELMAQDMQYYVDADEVRASIIQMFPNARLFSGLYHQDDPFMYNHDWMNFGTNLSWNLLELPSQWKQKDVAEYRKKIAWETRLSMSMGILTQVHLSHINVKESSLQFELASNLFKVKNRQLNVARVLESSGEMSSDDVMVFQVESLFARVNAVKSYANLQIALEQLSNALGRPLLLSGLSEHERPYGLEQCCEFAGLAGLEVASVERRSSELLKTDASPPERIDMDEELRYEIESERFRMEPNTPAFDPQTGQPYMNQNRRKSASYYKEFLRKIRDNEEVADRTLYDEQQDERSQAFFYGESPGEEGGRNETGPDEMPQEEYDPPGREGGLGASKSREQQPVAQHDSVLYYEDYLRATTGSTDSAIEKVDVQSETYTPQPKRFIPDTAEATRPVEKELPTGGPPQVRMPSGIRHKGKRDLMQKTPGRVHQSGETASRGPTLYEQQQNRQSQSPSANKTGRSVERNQGEPASRQIEQNYPKRNTQRPPARDQHDGARYPAAPVMEDEGEVSSRSRDRDRDRPNLYDQQQMRRSRSPSAVRDSYYHRRVDPWGGSSNEEDRLYDEERRRYYREERHYLRDERSGATDDIAESLYDEQQNERSQAFFYGESPGEEGGRDETGPDEMPQEEYDPPGREDGLGAASTPILNEKVSGVTRDGRLKHRVPSKISHKKKKNVASSTPVDGTIRSFKAKPEPKEVPLASTEVNGAEMAHGRPNLYEKKRNGATPSASGSRDESTVDRKMPKNIQHRKRSTYSPMSGSGDHRTS